MNTHSSSKKSIISIVVIFGVLALGYFYFSGGSPTQGTGSLVQSSTALESNADSARILALLNQIRSLKIDTSILKDPAYQTLVDHSVEIPPVNVGRPNPFAPIPGFSETPASGTIR